MKIVSWIDIILFLGLVQGVFLAVGFQFIKNKNVKANSLLSLILLMATVIMAARIAYVQYFQLWMIRWILIPDTIILLLGPLTYSYINKLLFKDAPVKKSFLLYFIPFLIYLGIGVFFILQSPDVYNFYNSNGTLKVIFILVEAFAILFNFYFLFKSLRMLKNAKTLEKENFSFEQKTVRYLQFFTIVLLLIISAWGIVFINGTLFNRYSPYINYNTIWIAIPFFIYLISYYNLKQPELFRISVKKSVKTAKRRLNDEMIETLDIELQRLMNEEKIYLNSYLTLKDLAKMLNSSTNNISWLLNEVHKKSFYDYINSYRIKEFIDQAENKKHIKNTILAMAYEVGFNSKSTFNNAFKLEMKQTPSSFIKSLETAY